MITEPKNKDKGTRAKRGETLDFLECHHGWCYAGWRIGDRVVEREITRDEFARLHEEHADELVAGPNDLPAHGYWAYAPKVEQATQWSDVMPDERGL